MTARATHQAIAAGYLHMRPDPHEPGHTTLPYALIGGVLTCYRCRDQWRPRTWTVLTATRSVCRACAMRDRELTAWQLLCDASDLMDQAMVAAGDRHLRDLFRQHFRDSAEHLSVWRYSEAGGYE